MKKALLIYIYLIITIFGNLTAQTVTDSIMTIDSQDSIIVVANRYKASLKSLAYSYQIIPKEQIQSIGNHSALEIVDLHFPSSFILEKKVMGFGVGTAGAGSVNLRGLGGKPNTGVLVLLNGHPDFMGIFGHPLPDVYGMDDIQQVEILAGPASTVFGNHAMGGVVNLVTEPDYNHLARISIEGGSFNSFNFGLNFSKNFGKQGVFLNARRKKTDGHIRNSAFESTQLNAGWSIQFNPVFSLSAQARYVPYSFDDPSRTTEDVAQLGTYGKIKRGTGEIIFRNNLSNLQGSTQIHTNLGKHQFYDGFKSTDYSYGISMYQNWLAGSNYSFAFGADLMQFGGQGKNKYAFLPNGKPVVNSENLEISSTGLYALGFYNPISYLDLKAGLRYQYNSLSIQNWAPVAGLALNLNSSLKLYSNYQSGFRNPTPMELYLFPTANENLEPEEVKSFEGGVIYQWRVNQSIQVSYYRNSADNLILTVASPSPPPLTRFENSGQTEQWGLETQLKLYLNKYIGMQLSYSYLDPGSITAFNPKNQFKYIINGGIKNYRIHFYGKYVEGYFTENDGQGKLPDYFLTNISLTYVSNPVDVYLKVLNLFDRKYFVLPNYRAPGIQTRLGFEFKL